VALNRKAPRKGHLQRSGHMWWIKRPHSWTMWLRLYTNISSTLNARASSLSMLQHFSIRALSLPVLQHFSIILTYASALQHAKALSLPMLQHFSLHFSMRGPHSCLCFSTSTCESLILAYASTLQYSRTSSLPILQHFSVCISMKNHGIEEKMQKIG